MVPPDPDPREDVYLLAALLSEVERVLHPLPRGMRGRVRPKTVFPPSLPTPEGPGSGRGPAPGAGGAGGIRGSGPVATAGIKRDNSTDGMSGAGHRVDSAMPNPSHSVTADSGTPHVLGALRLDTPARAFEQESEAVPRSLPEVSGWAKRHPDVRTEGAADAGGADRSSPPAREPGAMAIPVPDAMPGDAMDRPDNEPGGSVLERMPSSNRSPQARPETRHAGSSPPPSPDRFHSESNRDAGVPDVVVPPDGSGRLEVPAPGVQSAEAASVPSWEDRPEPPSAPAGSPIDGGQNSFAADPSGAPREPDSLDRTGPCTADDGRREPPITDLGGPAEDVPDVMRLHRFEPLSTDSFRLEMSGARGRRGETQRGSDAGLAPEPGLSLYPTPDSDLGAWIAAGTRVGPAPDGGSGLPASPGLGHEHPRVPGEFPAQADGSADAPKGNPEHANRSGDSLSSDDVEDEHTVADLWEQDDWDPPFVSIKVSDRYWRLSRSEIRRIDERLRSGFLDRALLRRR